MTWTALRRPAGALSLAACLLVACGSGSHGGGGDDGGAAPPAAAEITERNAEFVGAGGLRLGGTLTLPAGPAQGVPGVLIVPGVGALDRNSVAAAGSPDEENDRLSSSLNRSSPGTVDPLFRDLAQALARAGVASFRYDKRGTAASRLPPDRALSLDDEVADAKAALAFLAERREVGTAALGVLGHDLGGVVAMRLAAADPRVKAAALVSTPGRPLADVLAADFTRSRGPGLANQLTIAVASLQASGRVPPADSLAPLLRPVLPPGADGYLTSLFALDPVAETKGVPTGVLLVRGGADVTVTAADTDRLRAGFPAGAEVLMAGADVDHNLARPAPGRERDVEAADRLAAWLRAHLGG